MDLQPGHVIDAGSFGDWLEQMCGVLRGERDAEVPCGDCVGCCISSYPIPLRPDDVVARERVPESHLIGPARQAERWLMGFREDGSCPFLESRACTIYGDRPQTCRDYDCRLYAAAGLVPDGNRAAIEQRVRAWEFRFDSAAEYAAAGAVRRAAQFIRANARWFPPGMRAASATAAAVLAVKSWPLFLDPEPAEPVEETARRVIEAARAFDHESRAQI